MKRIISRLLFLIIIIIILPIFSLGNNVKAIENKKENIENSIYNYETEEMKEDTRNYTKEYIQWLELSDEEKAKFEVIPPKYKVLLEDFFKDKTEKTINSREIRVSSSIEDETEEIPESFDLRDKINIPIRNQKNYGLCWDFASMKSLETNLALHGYGDYDFSELHLDYIESEEFGNYRALHEGGGFSDFENYVSDNYGPVLESEVPYDAEYTIDDYEDLLNLNSKVIVKETINFPYIDKVNINYSEEQLCLFRNMVKKHIMKNGSLYSSICATESNEKAGIFSNVTMSVYNGKSVLNYQGEEYSNHAVSIIGWDDDFSIYNFPESCRPKEKGAYIAMNSWGENNNHSIIYISYEDKYVEQFLSGVVESNLKENINLVNDIEKIEFDDMNFYNEMKRILGRKIIDCNDENMTIYISKITQESVHNLELKNKNITSIRGIEKFPNLVNIDLSNNNISNIEYLRSESEVYKTICLDNNNIRDISALSYYNEIKINNNPIEAGIDKLNRVNTLELNNCNLNFKCLSDLSNLEEVRTLSIQSNNINDVSCFENSTIQYIDLSYNTNIKGIEKLTNQYEISLKNCNLNNSDIEKINIFSNVEVLDLSYNNITDCSKLKDMNIECLNLSGNEKIDLSTIPVTKNDQGSNYTHTKLILDNCNIQCVEFLRNSNIEYISLRNNQISDISVLQELRGTTTLDLSYTNISDVSSLSEITKLYLEGNKNLYNLDRLSNVKELFLDNCAIKDFSFIQGLNVIEQLSLTNNNIENLPILNKQSLCKIDLSDNNLQQFPDLSHTGCYEIILNNNKISNISNLESLLPSNLRTYEIYLLNNIIEDTPNIINERILLNYENQNIINNLELVLNKDNIIELPLIIKNEIKNRYKNNTSFETENCSIDYKNGRMIITPYELGSETAKIKVNGNKYKCKCNNTVYELKYEVKDSISVDHLEFIDDGYEKVYIEGSEFDTSNLRINAIYDNGLTYEINDYEILNSKQLSINQNNVVIEYNGSQLLIPIQVYSNEYSEVKFNEKRLYSIIKNLSSGNIGYEDNEKYRLIVKKNFVEGLTQLNLEYQDISDITGISKFRNLKELNLTGLYFKDIEATISEICKITTLENLKLSNYNYEGKLSIDKKYINSLLELPNLKEIDFGTNRWDSHGYIEDNKVFLPEFITSKDLQYITATCTYKNNLNEDTEEEIQVYVTDDDRLYVLCDTEITENKLHDERCIDINIETEKIKDRIIYNYSFSEDFGEQLGEIKVTTKPSKLSYKIGENFDLSLMVVTAIYNNGETKEITDYTILDGEDLKEDQNSITISYEENGITRTTKLDITVEEDVVKDESKYKIDGRMILAINPQTIISDFIRNFEDKYTIVVMKDDNEVNEGLLETGLLIKIYKNNKEKMNLTSIVIGDANGDGQADVKDMVKINNYRLYGTTSNFGEEYQKASDINNDGNIDIKDMIRINNYRLYGTSLIN